MHPVVFLSVLLCLQPTSLRPKRCPNPAHFDALDVHPYALTPTISASNTDDVSVPDVGRLTRDLVAAEHTGRARPAGQKSVWETEIEWDSSPPDPSGIPLPRQARHLALSFYQLWRQGVRHVFWYEIRDAGFSDGNLTGSGLFFRGGQPKPSTIAFRFPFVAITEADGIRIIWGRAPTAGTVTIEVERGRGWRPLVRLPTTAGGSFYALRRISATLVLRARAGIDASYPWPAS